ncbi:MAG: potassium transporter TrkG [Clostridia bacterium]|nr:potassium transporter TrkG [Clostridia bacterium]
MSTTSASRRVKSFGPIGWYTGKMMLLLAGVMAVPLVTSVIAVELPTVLDFVSGIGASASLGFFLMIVFRGHDGDLSWSQGMVVVALSWLAGAVLAAFPYYLSGHWSSYLDAMFDVMSGLTTTGIVLIQDLDHVSIGLNMWRHLLTWIGGQGIVVLALSFLFRSMPGAFKLYVGEGKDVRLQPNVISTARAIWMISIIYLVIGTAAQGIVGIVIGQPPVTAFLHGMWVFMAAWSTGGFTPMSQNIIYYHSLLYEIVTIVFFLIGSLNFNLHWAVMTGNRKELYRNLETATFAVTSTVLGALAAFELGKQGVYPDAVSLFRRGYYIILSAHTTTGFASVYARQIVLEWGPLALFAASLAMLFGGSASSTAGGFKAMRIGIAFKAVAQDVTKLILPESAVVVSKIHMGQDIVLEDKHVRPALEIIFLYVLSWFILVAATVLAGYGLPGAVFESASVIGNVGLSCGISTPAMPAFLKVLYILGMWVGRLEFMAVFVFVGRIARIVGGARA